MLSSQGASLSYAIGLAFLILVAIITGAGLFTSWLKKEQGVPPKRRTLEVDADRTPADKKKAA